VTWYRNGTLTTGSNGRLKLAVIANHLTFRAVPTTMLIVSAVDRPDAPAADAVSAFLSSTGPLDAWMDRIAQVR
jgi:hypothetical protein